MTLRAMLRRNVIGSSVVLMTALQAVGSSAQMLASAPTDVDRTHNSISNFENRINRADCPNASFTFTLNAGTLVGTNRLHVWASSGNADCSDPMLQDGGQCKQVAAPVTATVPLQVTVLARNIVRPETGSFTADAPESVCEQVLDLTQVTLQFFLVDTAGALIPGVATYGIAYDLIGPSPPTSVRAGIGERVLVISWRERSNAELDLGGYRIYVDEAGTSDGDAGLGGAPGDGGSSECWSDDLVSGEPPPLTRLSTTTNATATRAEARGLQNGVRYAVGVAAVDDFQNPGVLSALACGTPEPVTGFFETYRDAGGGGGGGHCAVGGRPGHATAAGVFAAALAFTFRRLRRERRNPNAKVAT